MLESVERCSIEEVRESVAGEQVDDPAVDDRIHQAELAGVGAPALPGLLDAADGVDWSDRGLDDLGEGDVERVAGQVVPATATRDGADQVGSLQSDGQLLEVTT